MDKSIKTRSVVKDIKTLNKRAGATHSIKTISTKTRNIAESVTASKVPRDRDGRAYAEEKVETGMHKGASRSAYSATNQIKGVANRTSQARKLTKDAAQTTARRTARHASDSAAHASRKAGKTGTKTISKSVKTIGRSTRATIKTANHTPTVAKSATASKAVARNAGFVARSAARAATLGAKAAGRAITAFVKMAIASAKSLAAALVAVGGTAVAAIVIICLVALIAVSAFGIFFTGGDLGDGNPSLREVVSKISEEHASRIDQIKASNAHDEISLNGTKTPWKEVLAIYAVKVT